VARPVPASYNEGVDSAGPSDSLSRLAATSKPEPLDRNLEERFTALVDRLRRNRPEDDLALLHRAFEFAAEQHRSQTRESGEPYLSHPLEVAHILADLRLDVTALCAALLHDIVEDTHIPLKVVSQRFGGEVARLVEGVTKISRIELLSPEVRQVESVRKMLLAMVTDVRVVLVKLADRLHNMRTLAYLPPEKQERIARETLDIYAPIAHRLGMGAIRGDLEDLAFRYLEPAAYTELKQKVADRSKEFETFLAEVQENIRKNLAENGLPADVEGRIKRLYSIHLKSQRQRRALGQIYDLLAVRIVTDSVRNCYAALGAVHQVWRPVPGRFKDYIAMPRPNLYQSLHTTVIHAGQPFEVQIRTQQMHRIAEQGVAAHWRYKDGAKLSGDDDQRIVWMRQLIEWAREMREPSEFLSTLKVDLYPEEVYVFTPKGKVIALPRGATPVDFAFSIHTEVGHQCVGAKVNGQMVPLRHSIANGDVVEILTQSGHGPSRDWLTFVQTSRARTKIRQWINLHERQQATDVGRRLIEKEARKQGVSLKKVPAEDLLRLAAEYGRAKAEDLYADIGYGKYSARQVVAKLTGKTAPDKPDAPAEAPPLVSKVKRILGIRDPGILVLGQENLMVYRAKCCNPIKGDPIIGYVTRGRGVAVHHTACPNVQKLLYQSERRIEVRWSEEVGEIYTVTLRVHAKDRPGLLASITSVISGVGANIQYLDSRPDNLQARIEATLDINDRDQLERILKNIKRIPGISDVERVYHV
jgi:GTP diphosphokinase / guanosine-3',5'-bis(diphosphate) 3'-diphosphatase